MPKTNLKHLIEAKTNSTKLKILNWNIMAQIILKIT
jgi:hypothetical protein